MTTIGIVARVTHLAWCARCGRLLPHETLRPTADGAAWRCRDFHGCNSATIAERATWLRQEGA